MYTKLLYVCLLIFIEMMCKITSKYKGKRFCIHGEPSEKNGKGNRILGLGRI